MTTLTQTAIAISSSTLLSILLKTTVAAAIGLVAAASLRHGRAALRHAVLACTLAVMLVLPATAYVMPSFALAVPAAAPPVVTSAPPASAVDRATPTAAPSVRPTDIRRNNSWASVATAAWAIGALIFAVPLLRGIVEMRRLRRTAVPWLEGRALIEALARGAGIRQPITVAMHEDISAPVTCGVRSPFVLLPVDAPAWDAPELRRAVVHELEHVRRRDWWIHLLSKAACATYWFHPFASIVSRQLALEAERACDDAVIANEESTQYAEQLVTLARRLSSRDAQPALAMASRSDLARRVSSLLDNRQARGRAGAVHILLIAALAASLALVVAPARIVRAAPPPVGDRVAGGQRVLPRELRPAPWSSAAPSRGDRALVEAAEQGDLDEVRWLLDAGANVDASVPGDGSPLIVAAREGHLAAVTLLLDRGANPNLGVDGDGNPLIMAAREGHVPIVELLLNRGASVDEAVDGDENALIQASAEGRLEVVKLLVSRGANVNMRIWADRGREREGEWRTPLNQARRGRHGAVVAFLQSAGAVE